MLTLKAICLLRDANWLAFCLLGKPRKLLGPLHRLDDKMDRWNVAAIWRCRHQLRNK